MKTCPIHHTPLTCAACTGAQGGQATSPAKRAAAQANAKQPRTLMVCTQCGHAVRGPVLAVRGVLVHGGHVEPERDTTCGLWGFRRAPRPRKDRRAPP